MGLIYSNIKLSNPANSKLAAIDVEALADTGAMHLCIPETIAIQLKLKEFDKRPVTIANGQTEMCSYVGPIKVDFKGRISLTGALVLGNKVLLGAIPMEDMDIVLHPLTRKVVPNPNSPNIPASIAM